MTDVIRYSYRHAPTLWRFAQSNAFIRGLMGPFRSGKSSACVVELLRRAQQQAPGRDGVRRTRWQVVRNCYDDQTEILTEKRGWQLFRNLTPEDRVATLHGQDRLVFELPSYYSAQRYTGDMLGISNDAVDFLVTPDHKLWTSKRQTRQKVWSDYSHEPASAAFGRDLRRFKRDAVWLDGEARYSVDFYEFLGFWFAEGYAGVYQYADRKAPHWRFVVVQKRHCAYVRDLLVRAGLSYGETISKSSGCSYFRIRIAPALKPLIAELAALGKSTVKSVPEWLKNAPQGHARAFLTGFIWGDGSFRKDSSRVTAARTSSRQLADDLQEIALRAGWVANVTASTLTPDRRGRHRNTDHAYTVTFLQPSRHRPVGRGGWYRKNYDGMVYCVTVSTHVVYVRRNGKAFWCGQTTGELRDTTIKTFFMWAPPGQFGEYNQTNMNYLIKGIPGCEIEVMFRALDRPDHVQKLLSLELTGCWFNEAREIPWSIIQSMEGRVKQYPSLQMGGCTWGGIWMDTNPPDTESAWYRFFEEKTHHPAYAEIFKQPSGLSAEAENIPYINGGREYYVRISTGKDEDWIKVYVHGQYGFTKWGKAIFPEYSDALHCREVDPVPGLPIYRGFDWGLCYDDRTEVLTDAGWKLFKDVDVDNDLIATRHPKTGALEYARAVFKIEEDFDGELLEWASTELNMCVTPEHRIPFTHRDHPNDVRWASAEWLAGHMGRHHMVDLVSVWEPPAYVMEPAPFFDAKTFAEFMGLYLSEGSLDREKGRVTIAQHKRDPDMQGILDRTGLTWRWRDRLGWRTTHHALAQYLAQFGLAHDKHVPRQIRMMEQPLILAFITAYTRGDGHIRTRKNGAVEHTIYTVSRRMAGDLQELAQKVGWNSSANYEKPQRSVILERGSPRVIQNGGGWRICFKKRAVRAELHRRNFRRVAYQGKVYCLNVPHHTLYVRRNGKAHWNGNTPACTFSQLIPDGRWLIFDEMTSDDMSVEDFLGDVDDYSQRSFTKRPTFIDTGDPAGQNRSEIDKRSCFMIAQAKGFDVQPGIQSILVRLESVRKPLRRIINGAPQLILHPRCKLQRKGFLGGYHYREKKTVKDQFEEKPFKNEYSHPMEATQYVATRIFGTAVLSGIEREKLVAEAEAAYYAESGVDDSTRSDSTGY